MINLGRSSRIEVWAALLTGLGAIDLSKLGSPDVVRVALVVVAITCVVELVSSPLFSLETVSAPPVRWFLLWLAWAGGSAVFAPNGPGALLVVGMFAVLGAAAVHINVAAGEDGLARTLIGAFAVLVVVSLVVRVLSGNSEVNYQDGRLALLSLEANQLARMAAITTLACAWLAVSSLRSKSLRGAAVGVIGFIGSILVILAGGSRTGTAALVAGLIVFCVALAPQSRQRMIAGVGLGALVVGVAFAALSLGGISELFDRVETTAGREEDAADAQRDVQSLNGRLNIWPEILVEVGDEPVSGHGLGNDRKVVTDLFAVGRIGWKAQHTHNLALQILLTTGVVGLALMAVAFTSLAARVFYAGMPLAPALLVLILIDGISEAAIRVPSFGWFGLIAAAAVAAKASGRQLKAEKTVVTRSSISSTARS